MEASVFEEEDFFRALDASHARVLLIGRRALIALGAPVLTADYDLWVHIDDIDALNAALRPLELRPNRSAADARATGRYVLEGDERVDVMVARAKPTKDGVVLAFDDAWARKVALQVGTVSVYLPCISDLITTKRWAMREKDLTDITFLERLAKGAS